MDYMGILKKAWTVTWRYKILWLFGLFAGAGGGGGSINYSLPSNSSGSGTGGLSSAASTAQFEAFMTRYLGLIIIVALFFVVLGLLLWIIGVAARGGLIHLVNDAEERREVRASAGWQAGFAKWWRVFAVGFLADLPVLILGLVVLVIVVVGTIGTIAASRASSESIGAAIGSAVVGMCCFLAVFGLAAIVLGVIFGIVKELAFRYAVLQDRGIMESLKMGWHDLWAKRGAFLQFLILFGVGILFGLAIGAIALVMVVPAAMMFAFRNWLGGSLLLFAFILVLMVPAAMYSTFYHAVWTIFFRRMTGAEPLPTAAPAPAYPIAPPVPPVPSAPVAAPYGHEVPMPPEPWAPPAPPAPEPPAAPPAEPPAGADA
jgi:hypothetical protein